MHNYRMITGIISPLLPLWIYWRQMRGKEDPKRIKERFGYASQARPAGTLLWLHAASVGEANSVLILIQKIRERFPDIRLLLTTGTVTSARLMQTRLPREVIHQYLPIDTPKAVERFIRHWRPDMAFWVESEFWPNLVMAANDSECFMGVINGRMSERSFAGWKKKPRIIRAILSCFDVVFAQTEEDGRRLQELGARDVMCVGNLKYDAALLPCNEAELTTLKAAIGARPLWVAASTHPGEEAMIAQAHTLLAAMRPDLLTIIVPRHPERGGDIAAELRKQQRVALRSRKEPVTAQTQIYIADTLGELGLFYRLSEIAFMGGSLAQHGGQNPLEPARLSCTILTGPHTHNFMEIYQDMEKAGCCLRVTNPENLAAQIDTLLNNATVRSQMQAAVRKWMEGKGGAAERLLETLGAVLDPKATLAPPGEKP
jgi:3-deoxy-D-manno-octulosonic-acid transferase